MSRLFETAVTFALIALTTTGSSALAADRPADAGVDAVVQRHLDAFVRHDWDSAILDYADDAVFVLPSGPIQGKAAILAFFHSLDAQKPRPIFTASKVPGVGRTGMEDWVMNPGQPGAVKGRDVFVISNGKISVQCTIGFGPAAQ